jgi:hypothetical protein
MPQTDRQRLPVAIKLLLAANLFLGVCNLFYVTPKPDRNDEAGYMSWARAFIVAGNFNPTNYVEWNECHPLMHINGRTVCVVTYPIGWSVAAFPFMAAGQEICRASNAFLGTHYTLDGGDPPVVRLAWFGICIWATLGLLAIFLVVARFTANVAASFATIIAWLGTSAFAYTWKSPGMSHGVSLAFIAITYWLALRAVDSGYKVRYLLCLGFCASMVVCCRITDVVLLLPLGFLLLGARTWRADENEVSRLPADIRSGGLRRIPFFVLASFFPLILLQMNVWKSVSGEWISNGYVAKGEGFTIHFKNIAKLLLSSDHGLFFYHAVTLVSFWGLIHYARQSRTFLSRMFAVACLLSLTGTIILFGLWHDWDLGDSYGARWAANCALFWALGIAIAVDSWGSFVRWKRWGLIVLALPSCLLIVGQIAGRIVRTGPLHIYLPGYGWRQMR